MASVHSVIPLSISVKDELFLSKDTQQECLVLVNSVSIAIIDALFEAKFT